MTYDRLLGWLNVLRNDVRITVVTTGVDDRRGRGKTLLSSDRPPCVTKAQKKAAGT